MEGTGTTVGTKRTTITGHQVETFQQLHILGLKCLVSFAATRDGLSYPIQGQRWVHISVVIAPSLPRMLSSVAFLVNSSPVPLPFPSTANSEGTYHSSGIQLVCPSVSCSATCLFFPYHPEGRMGS